jgi:hypothetical protein
MSLATQVTYLAIPQLKSRGLPPRRREGTAEIVILPCIRYERIGDIEAARPEAS